VRSLKVLFVASEMAPFAKTGGLADVAGALPDALMERGVDVCAVIPGYRSVREREDFDRVAGIGLNVPLGPMSLEADVLETATAHGVPVLAVEREDLFDRPNLYGTGGRDYYDNLERFAFFSRAALLAAGARGFEPDIVHCHDWQTGLIPALIREVCPGPGSVFTIHNLGYQGLFPREKLPYTGLSQRVYQPEGLEYWGRMSLLKAGIVYADTVTTVSPTYAREIQTEAFGHGLEGALAQRRADLHGVVNGIDTALWNPAADPHIPSPYSSADLAGKARCKEALLAEAGIEADDRPLFASITRLDAQKGVDLICEVLDDAVQLGMRFVLLGTGDPAYGRQLREAEARHPGKVKVFLAFSDAMAHRIEAGADALVMPSRYEPCGLNQLMSLRYGTVPVVRTTGGLADTVVDYSEGNLAAGVSTGFTFRDPDSDSLLKAIARALRVYSNRRAWARLVANGMAQDFSWRRSAAAYLDLYESTVNRPPHTP